MPPSIPEKRRLQWVAPSCDLQLLFKEVMTVEGDMTRRLMLDVYFTSNQLNSWWYTCSKQGHYNFLVLSNWSSVARRQQNRQNHLILVWTLQSRPSPPRDTDCPNSDCERGRRGRCSITVHTVCGSDLLVHSLLITIHIISNVTIQLPWGPNYHEGGGRHKIIIN